MKSNPSKHNWCVDLILFVGLILMFFLDLTGIGLHQWIGIAVGLPGRLSSDPSLALG